MARPNRPVRGKNDPAATADAAAQTTPGAQTAPGAQTTPAAGDAAPTAVEQAALGTMRAERDGLAERLRAAESERDAARGEEAGLRKERDDLSARVRAAESERDALSQRAEGERRLAEQLRAENERLAARLREADEHRAQAGSLGDEVRALAAAAGLDHLRGPREVLEAIRARVGALKGRAGSGFTGVKRFQGHGTFLRGKPGDKDRDTVTLGPGDAIPDDADLTGVDPRLITVE